MKTDASLILVPLQALLPSDLQSPDTQILHGASAGSWLLADQVPPPLECLDTPHAATTECPTAGFLGIGTLEQ